MENNSLLNMLLLHPGEYMSGEEISRRLSISRTAVWKQINKLREAGYEFEAVSRKGYRLLHRPARLDTVSIMLGMQTKRFGRNLKLLETTTSTQEEVRRNAEIGAAEGMLVIAEEQTLGRGRQGRSWFSPPGKGVWMSLLLRPDQSLACAPQLTLLTAVAVCRAIRTLTQIDAGIKWPNDLLVNGRKISGILLESVAEDERIRYCIAGIGIDVNMDLEDYPEELRTKVTSLKLEQGAEVDRAALISAILQELETLYDLYQEEGFSPIAHLWEALSVTLNREVTLHSGSQIVQGYAVGLDSSGGLIVQNEEGKKVTVFSGEVQLNT
ncbi:BirA family biotin operon repressor/biotin-[acetyl-CoA-carboxylase] ligase [Paenibacillus shirakamiensis]|uniref:Bifunctional ligase/repressor BirA n=1 Tax=Paenibacillus shirakamiensis TaxID=1265935 RepID=A0ABS4JG69_9BACL|nr:biotin--[acetyl-CoA-carboxylase] ligase [Paenibacillus shirakamiensis]MBP1999574.1 BirA family biotin operon repressor/biotin-[acetyl-CoA-carboxylase] ligase [Paenibacillus shirakamiensis]